MSNVRDNPVKQAPDEIAIVTQSPARAEALRQAIVLRGFDEIVCLDVRTAAPLLQAKPPVLVIIDLENDLPHTIRLLEALPAGVRSLVLADAFDEVFFVACHDRGARDFMVHPVPDAILVSRVIRNLQEHRLAQVARHTDQILVEMNVLSSQSGVFTTPYLINLLRQSTETYLAQTDAEPLSLLILQLGGYESPLPAGVQGQVLATLGGIIKECARGLDVVGEYFLDKFAVIMPQTSIRGANALASRLGERLQGLSFEGLQGPFWLTVQTGVAEAAGCRHYEGFLNRALANMQPSVQVEPLASQAGELTFVQAPSWETPLGLEKGLVQPTLSPPSNLI